MVTKREGIGAGDSFSGRNVSEFQVTAAGKVGIG